MNFSITKIKVDNVTYKYKIFKNNQPLTWRVFLDLLKRGDLQLLSLFNYKLFNNTFGHSFFENVLLFPKKPLIMNLKW